MTKTKTPSIQYVVLIDYNRYVFDTVEKAARLVDLLAQGRKVSSDYHAPERDDCARVYYTEKVTLVAEIEAVNMVLNSERTPEAVLEPIVASVEAA